MYWTEIENQSKKLGAILTQNQQTIATAESCTGGGIAYALTEIAGSSAYFNQSWVTYSNQAKQSQLNVNAKTLELFGAVSEQTVIEMVAGCLHNAQADIALVTSGIAGPGGGSPDKPVGLVYFAWQLVNQPVKVESIVFKGTRAEVREQAILHSLKQAINLLS
ncbi:CinA family protein [Catenovulum adriaticum]|uniref:CinA family protein n=1 Tax=Catenovulum adriaticum TaxID=2984846 RepID=A0ABY7AKM9_9ALTE|nr:CinA family protein [Catenovulum sp. TS8]WAJ69788.1 CinA family protein [Catenovulum sp. TS8]